MLQNLKVDIVYYKMETDFEMEFNLGGCCRMRLLTDKAEEKKDYLNMLSRAVQRSRVIISCGLLFTQNGIINITAHSIGKGLETVSKDEYGINSNDEIQIIKGSTPLVTPDGIFGGCIIESGPQTIILLSESKSVRKTIMKNLIHPYIEDISALQPKKPQTQDKENAVVEQSSEEIPETEVLEEPNDEIAETEENKEITEEKEETEQENKTSFSSEHNIEFVMFDGTDDTQNIPDDTVVENPGLVIEPSNVKYSKKSYYELDYSNSEMDEDFYFEGKEKIVTKKNYKLPIILISILLVLVLILLAFCIFYIPIINKISIPEYIKQIFAVGGNLPKRF